MYLSTRCLRTKQIFIVNIECILLILGGVIRRDIECFEVVIVFFNFRSFNNLIAHACEDSFYLFKSDGVGVMMTNFILLGRKSYVDNLSLELGITCCSFHLVLGLFKYLLDSFSCLIYKLTNLWSVLGSNVLHALKDACELTFFTKNVDSDLIKFVEAVRLTYLLKGLLSNFVELFTNHNLPPYFCVNKNPCAK